MLKRAASLLAEATAAGRIPGAVLRVELRGQLAHESAHGVTRYDAPAPVTPHTWFDLASLTKILATTPAAMLLVQRGALDLDEPIGRWLPALTPAFAGQPLHRFLSHTSGAAAWRPFYERVPPEAAGSLAGKPFVVKALLAEAPEYEPGSRQVYSDVGMALAGLAIEAAAGAPLQEFVAAQVFAALGATNLAYLQINPRPTPSLAATEQCPWRGRTLAGEAHDENTWAAGGCLGQSGVFGDAAAVCRVMAEFQAAWDEHSAWLSPDVLRRFLRRPEGLPRATFRLGFDSPSESGSAAGDGFGPHSFGHLGFTGASVWCDPYSALTVALLTNRVHPTRVNEAIKELRPLVHNAVIEELAR